MDIHYDNGNFSIDSNNLYSPNLALTRMEFKLFMKINDAISKLEYARNFADHSAKVRGWYDRWKFEDVYSCNGYIFTLKGITECSEDTYNDPYRGSFGLIGIGSMDKRQKLFSLSRGRLVRPAVPEDSGIVRLLVKGYNDIADKEPSVQNLLGLLEPKLIKGKKK